MSSKSRLFSQLAQEIDENGNLSAEVFGAGTSLGLDSAAVTNLIDSDYVASREADAGGVTTGKSIAMSIVFGG